MRQCLHNVRVCVYFGTAQGRVAAGKGGGATRRSRRRAATMCLSASLRQWFDAPCRRPRRVSAVRSALAVTECGYGGRMFIHGTTATRSRWFDRCLGSHSRYPKLPARRLQLQWQRSTVSRPSTRRSCREMPKKPKPLGSLWKTSTHTSDSGCPHRCGSQRPRRMENGRTERELPTSGWIEQHNWRSAWCAGAGGSMCATYVLRMEIVCD